MSQKSSLHRVLEILNRLNDGEKLCVSRLVAEYEVSERTVQRDFKMILEVFDDFLIKDGECYKGYKKVLLDELLQGSDLMMLSNIVNVFDISNISFNSKKTQLLIKKSTDIYYFKSNPIEKINNKALLKKIEHSIKFNKEIKLLYHGRNTYNQELIIQPSKVVFTIGNFYLVGKDIANDKIKRLRISNIEKLDFTNKTFHPNKEVEHYIIHSQTFLANDSSKDIRIRLRVAHIRAKYLYYNTYLPSQKIIKEFENGDIEVEYHVNNLKEITTRLIRWLPEVTILEPQELKELLKESLLKKLKGLELDIPIAW